MPRLAAVSIAAAATLGVTAIAASAIRASVEPEAPGVPPVEERSQPRAPGFTDMLVRALESVEGCLGVELAQTAFSERALVIAWFEDKEAAIRCYNHPTHRFFVRAAGGDPDGNTPLEHVEAGTPVMVMASILMADEGRPPLDADNPMMPVHSISIEMYTPLPGGAMLNGRLAPIDFPIERMDGAPLRVDGEGEG